MKVTREWLCFSPDLKRPYCHTCWLFADRTSPNLQWQWIDGVPGSSRHYSIKIKRHESSSIHIASIAVCQRWKAGQRLDEEQERAIRNEANFWRQVLAWLVNAILTLSVLCLAFRGHREYVRDGECAGGNFLGLTCGHAGEVWSCVAEPVEFPCLCDKVPECESSEWDHSSTVKYPTVLIGN